MDAMSSRSLHSSSSSRRPLRWPDLWTFFRVQVSCRRLHRLISFSGMLRVPYSS